MFRAKTSVSDTTCDTTFRVRNFTKLHAYNSNNRLHRFSGCRKDSKLDDMSHFTLIT